MGALRGAPAGLASMFLSSPRIEAMRSWLTLILSWLSSYFEYRGGDLVGDLDLCGGGPPKA